MTTISATPTTKKQDGFTLVELLVVIVILGIIIAIAVPTFLNQQDKAQDSSAKTSLAVAYRSAEAASVATTDRSYPSQKDLVSHFTTSEPQLEAEGIAQPEDAQPGHLGVVTAGGGTLVLASMSGSGCLFTLTVVGHGQPAWASCDDEPIEVAALDAPTIISGPADPSRANGGAGLNAISIDFVSNELSATTECSLNSSDPLNFVPCSSPYTYTSLIDGPPLANGSTNTVYIRNREGGLVSDLAAHTWTVDTVSTLTGVHTWPLSPGNHSLPYFTGVAESGATVTVYRGTNCTSAPVAVSGSGETFNSSGLQIKSAVTVWTPTSFRVRSVDALGNVSSCQSVSYTWQNDFDLTPSPHIYALNPVNSEGIGFKASVVFAYDMGFAEGTPGFDHLECSLDDQYDWRMCTSLPFSLTPGTGEYSADSTFSVALNSELNPGDYTFRVRANSYNGGSYNESSFNFTID